MVQHTGGYYISEGNATLRDYYYFTNGVCSHSAAAEVRGWALVHARSVADDEPDKNVQGYSDVDSVSTKASNHKCKPLVLCVSRPSYHVAAASVFGGEMNTLHRISSNFLPIVLVKSFYLRRYSRGSVPLCPSLLVSEQFVLIRSNSMHFVTLLTVRQFYFSN